MKIYTLLFTAITAFSQANKTQTVTPQVLANLQVFAEYSAAAYCSDNYLVPFNGSIVCPTAICPLLPTAPEVQLADSFIKVSFYQTTGLIMLDHNNKLIVVSFRGTHSSRDWLTDLDFLLDDASDICKGCEGHSGFLGSWRGVKNIVLNDWNDLRHKYPTYKTIATGHSLGGAVANLCAAQMKTIAPGASVYLFTFGSPRVGNDKFAKYIESVLALRNFRVTHLNDPVPQLPPRWPGFQHPGPEYSITSPHFPGVLAANSSTLLTPANLGVNPSDVLILSGGETKQGSDGYGCSNPAMHGSYLGQISGCGSNNLAQQDSWEELCGDLFLCCNGLTGARMNNMNEVDLANNLF